MAQQLLDKLNITELSAYQSILAQRMGQMDYLRERNIPIDFDLYESLQIKKNKIDSRINQLIELL